MRLIRPPDPLCLALPIVHLQVRVCAAQLLRVLLAVRPQYAAQRQGAYVLRSLRKFMTAR